MGLGIGPSLFSAGFLDATSGSHTRLQRCDGTTRQAVPNTVHLLKYLVYKQYILPIWLRICYLPPYKNLKNPLIQSDRDHYPFPPKTNMTIAGKSTMNEAVFPIEHGDFPASHVSFSGV